LHKLAIHIWTSVKLFNKSCFDYVTIKIHYFCNGWNSLFLFKFFGI